VKRWVKVLLVLLAAFVVLLVLNAIALTSETKDAELNVDGAELIETSNGTLQVLDEGDPQGSPVVLIHGATESMHWFEELGPLLGTDHRVIRVDLLGHGGSDKPGAGYAITDQANAVAEALAQLDVTGATVVGNSLGGSVATGLAEQSPDLVTGIVILDQAPNDSYSELPWAVELGYWPIIGPALSRASDIAPDSVVLDAYENAFVPGYNIASGFEDPDQPVDDLREMTYTAFDDINAADEEYRDARTLDDRLSAIEVPLLVIFGAEDQIYDAEEAIRPYEDVTGARTELLDGVGHSPNVEVPEEVAVLVGGFIARTEAAARAERRATARKEARRRAARKAAARAKAQAKRKAAQKAQKAQGSGKDGKAGADQPAEGN
jgi:pimeloyl-ACP methyl ester carboxylesterase